MIFLIAYIILCLFLINNYIEEKSNKIRNFVCLTRNDLEILINAQENSPYTQQQLNILDKIGY